jgi:hypothetical protein
MLSVSRPIEVVVLKLWVNGKRRSEKGPHELVGPPLTEADRRGVPEGIVGSFRRPVVPVGGGLASQRLRDIEHHVTQLMSRRAQHDVGPVVEKGAVDANVCGAGKLPVRLAHAKDLESRRIVDMVLEVPGNLDRSAIDDNPGEQLRHVGGLQWLLRFLRKNLPAQHVGNEPEARCVIGIPAVGEGWCVGQ